MPAGIILSFFYLAKTSVYAVVNCFPWILGNIFGMVIFQSTYEKLLSKNHLLGNIN